MNSIGRFRGIGIASRVCTICLVTQRPWVPLALATAILVNTPQGLRADSSPSPQALGTEAGFQTRLFPRADAARQAEGQQKSPLSSPNPVMTVDWSLGRPYRRNNACGRTARNGEPQRNNSVTAKAPTHAVSPMAAVSLGGEIVADAIRYRGRPYVRGSSLPSRGFDCSGLVYRVLLQRGIRIPRTSAAMFNTGRDVRRDQLQLGDLVFFTDSVSRRISHVGIYIGGGRFIHSSQRGSGVIVSDMTQPYFINRWAGARRIR